MRLLQGRTTAEAAHVVNTVRAQAERTDALVIAEGIETIKHAREAAAAGATVGQGFLFGGNPLGGGGLGPGGAPHHQGRAGRDLHAAGAPGPGRGRAQRVVVTHDRELVIRAAEPLLRRLVPEH